MIITHAIILGPSFEFFDGSMEIENGRITKLICDPSVTFQPTVKLRDLVRDSSLLSGNAIVDGEGLYLLPGLIDVHMHGYGGFSCEDRETMKLLSVGKRLAKKGVTSYAATVSTDPIDKMVEDIRGIVRAMKAWTPKEGSRILGIHSEGPFMNPEKKGAMNANYMDLPTIEAFESLYEAGEGELRLMTLAPERKGALNVIAHGVSRWVHMSMGHTNATYQETLNGFRAGITRATHTFNAMRSLSHRESGPLGAILTEPDIQCELIGDFVHVAPEVCKLLYQLKGSEHITLISDACQAAGLSTEELPPEIPIVITNAAYLPNGTLCGSTCSVLECVKNMTTLGIKLEDAVRMASLNPARDLGLDGETGSLDIGKKADFFLSDGDLCVASTFIEGELYV